MLAYILPAIQLDYLYGFWPAVILLIALFIFFMVFEWIWISLATPNEPEVQHDNNFLWLYRVRTVLAIIIMLGIALSGAEYCHIDQQGIEYCTPIGKRLLKL